jgi:hypothetical protein
MYLYTKIHGITPKNTKVVKFAFCVVYCELFLIKFHGRFVSGSPDTERVLMDIKFTVSQSAYIPKYQILCCRNVLSGLGEKTCGLTEKNMKGVC